MQPSRLELVPTRAAAPAERVERTVKAGLRWVSAVNQSRLKAVLDPLYEASARTLLRGVKPSAALAQARYADNLFFDYRARAAKVQYRIEDWDWSEARPELLTARQRAFLQGSTIGETSGFAVGAGFLHTFRNDPELGSFFGIWFTEELNHYWGYHRYLERMGEGFTAERKLAVTGVDFRAYTDDVFEMAAANMYQELVAYLIYRSFARQVGDPFLSRMIDAFAKDELRHYKFYESVVARTLQRQPEKRYLALKHFLKATTPVNQVSGGPRQTLSYLAGAAYYFRKPEFDFLVKQVGFLFGEGLEPSFAFFYRRHLDPCARCGAEVFRCPCPDFERAAA